MDWKTAYTALVPFLGAALGPDYEIVLHDVTDGHRVLANANTGVSGRGPDASLSGLGRQFMQTGRYKQEDSVLNYQGVSADGKMLRCSTHFIKDENGGLLGMLCINFNQQKYSAFAASVLGFVADNFAPQGGGTLPAPGLVEDFAQPVSARVHTVLQELYGAGGETARLTAAQRQQVVARLAAGGVFRVKGAAAEVARLLGCSVPSVYRYLAAVRDAGPEG